MKLCALRDRPDLVTEVAGWHHAEWQALYPGKSLGDFADDLRLPPGADGVPRTWLLLDGEAVVGTASLLAHDMATNRDLTPWLANIYIRPERRGEGLGRQLVRHAMEEARQLGIATLYLFTADQQAFYERLGWSLLKVEPYEGTPVAIMACRLSSLAAAASAWRRP